MAVLTEESLAMMGRCWPLLEALTYEGKVALGDRDKAQALLGAMPSLLHAYIKGADGTLIVATARPGGGLTCTVSRASSCTPSSSCPPPCSPSASDPCIHPRAQQLWLSMPCNGAGM